MSTQLPPDEYTIHFGVANWHLKLNGKTLDTSSSDVELIQIAFAHAKFHGHRGKITVKDKAGNVTGTHSIPAEG